MAIWNPWRGCHKYSSGCLNCYIHKADERKGINTDHIVKTNQFDYPVQKNKKGEYKIKSGTLVYLCFQSDFFIEDADSWRVDCWNMIKERHDVTFLFLTKRIKRFFNCIPNDWADGYPNVIISTTVEDQISVDERLSFFQTLPIKHKNIVCQPLLEQIDLSPYLNGIDLVVVGGESGKNTRVMDFDWVLDIRKQCVEHNVSFQFRQVSSNFMKDNKRYSIQPKLLTAQARSANINFLSNK
ncbi:MAG TPA: DUF5131 family protein [Bacilli bacterium]|nr:DUF5131 family protein [Bacilli bacterium]